MVLLFAGLTVVAFSQTLDHMPPAGTPGQEDMRIKESEAFGGLYSDLLTQATSQQCLDLAIALRKDDKPIPALKIIEFGINNLKPDADATEIKKLADVKKDIQDRIAYLKKRFDFFEQDAKEKGTQESFGGMAAIKYHMGFIRDSVGILDAAIKSQGAYSEFTGLKRSFYNEIHLNSTAYLKLIKEFQTECENGIFEKALPLAGELCYIGIYSENPLEILDMLKQTFPDKVNMKAIDLLHDMPEALKRYNFKKGI
jgi:hypothetical protein